MRAVPIGRFLRTIRPIPPGQLGARARGLVRGQVYRWRPADPLAAARRVAAREAAAADHLPALPFALLAPHGAVAVSDRARAVARGRFEFAGVAREVASFDAIAWQGPHPSPLWAFCLHYLGPVLDLTLDGRADAAAALLASWRRAMETRWDPVAWHPYPTSLRLAHLCLAASHVGGFEPLAWDGAALAATHAAYLLEHLEHDLRGNHLLENARALLLAGRSLSGPLAERCARAARALLAREVPEQVFPDGGHFELSPMYHATVLHRLLEMAAVLGEGDTLVRDVLRPAIGRMAAFLEGICCPDGDIPLLGDSARGVAPPPAALLALAGARPTASVRPGVRHFSDSGLHVWRGEELWAVLDAGPVCAAYLPGHGQADSLTVEVWCGETCLVTDPGVHDYTGPERSWGRSSRAHSTITLDDRDTSEVYGSFRIGGRARIAGVREEGTAVTATLVPWDAAARLTRTVGFADARGAALRIADRVEGAPGRTARSRLHLHPAVRVLHAGDGELELAAGGRHVRVRAAGPLRLESGRASRELGRVEPTTIVVQDLPRDGTGVGRGTFGIEVVA